MKHLRENVMHVAEAWLGWEAIKGLGEYVKSTIEAVENTNILAERVGFSSEAFQALAYAASFAHIDADQLAISLGQMSKRLGEVAMTGEGPAVSALKHIGLTAQQLVAMGPEKAFLAIIEAMEKIKNPAQRSALAVELFGKAGQGMINLIARGGDDLKTVTDEAKRMGIALNSIDNEKVREAGESMKELSGATTGFANLLVAQIAPYLTRAIDLYLEWAYSGKKSADFLSQGSDWIVTGLGRVIDAVNLVKSAWAGWQMIATSTFKAVIDGIIAVDSWTNTGLQKRTKAQQEWIDTYKAISADLGKLAQQQGEAGKGAFDKIGHGHDVAKALKDNFEEEARKRAKLKADAANKFIEPGAITGGLKEPKFAGALELGSKEAYAATLTNQRRTEDTKQDQIIEHVKTTAEAGKDSVLLLKQINDTLKGGAGNLVNGLGKL